MSKVEDWQQLIGKTIKSVAEYEYYCNYGFTLEFTDGTRVNLTATYDDSDVELEYVVPDTQNDGWVQWGGGGECPVTEGTRVSLILRGGRHVYSAKARACNWNHHNDVADIMQYRIVGVEYKD